MTGTFRFRFFLHLANRDGKETVIMGSMEELIGAIEKSIEAGFTENPFKDLKWGIE